MRTFLCLLGSAAVALSIVIAGHFVTRADPQTPETVQQRVVARELVIVDEDGTPRIRLSAKGRVAEIQLYDDQHRERFNVVSGPGALSLRPTAHIRWVMSIPWDGTPPVYYPKTERVVSSKP